MVAVFYCTYFTLHWVGLTYSDTLKLKDINMAPSAMYVSVALSENTLDCSGLVCSQPKERFAASLIKENKE